VRPVVRQPLRVAMRLPMRLLAIDSATEACSAALFEDGRLLAGAFELIGRGHAERLVPMIAELPERGWAGRIAVSLGPGSFTGVRIGLAAARALGLAWGAEVLGYPTAALVAAMARAERGEAARDAVAVCMNGGHGEWFVASFDAAGLPQGEVVSLSPDEAVARVTAPLVAGNRARELVEQRGSGEALELLPDARQIQLLPQPLFRADLAPLYGRGPDARLPGAARA